MMKQFRAMVSQHTHMAEELPLVHTSRSEFLPRFAAEGCIKPRRCDVFGEELVYLFYGRPAYRSQNGTMPGAAAILCPICFVFRPYMEYHQVHRMFPCDSGAISSGIFAPDLQPEDIEKLAVEPTIESARRLVSAYFETNENYFWGKMRRGIAPLPGQPDESWLRVAMKDGPARFDDRRTAIEVQVNAPVFLKNRLLFVLLPREFLGEPTIRRAILEDWNCDPVPYDTVFGASPSEYYAVLRQELASRFKTSTRL